MSLALHCVASQQASPQRVACEWHLLVATWMAPISQISSYASALIIFALCVVCVVFPCYCCIHTTCFYCRTIYEQLGMAVSEEQRSLYTQRVDEITPNVRYCAYNIKDMPSDLSELMKLRSSAHGDEMLASKIDVSRSPGQRLRLCDVCPDGTGTNTA